MNQLLKEIRDLLRQIVFNQYAESEKDISSLKISKRLTKEYLILKEKTGE